MTAAGAGPAAPDRGTAAGPGPRAIALLLFFSGAGSLALEVTWSRSLRLVFGSTTLAISTILVAYMLGLGLGGLLGARLARRVRDGRQGGLRLYGLFEIVVGLYALVVPLLLKAYPALHHALLADAGFWPAAFVRFGLALVVLLVPTLLMGATLPVLVAGVVRERASFGAHVGLLYGANTLGAVAGTLGTTFVLFPVLGLRGTNAAGAVLDLGAGVAALWLARRVVVPAPAAKTRAATAPGGADSARVPGEPATADDGNSSRARGRARWMLGAYAVVGFTALACEVAWTRTLALAVGSSIHAFAAMLAAFLTGIALGALALRRVLARLRDTALAFGAGIAALGVTGLLTALMLPHTPAWTLALFGASGAVSPGAYTACGFIVSIAAMILPTLVLGALFPLSAAAIAGAGAGENDSAAASAARRDGGATVGAVYCANTLGAASGAFCAGFLLIPRAGVERTIEIVLALAFVAAAAVLALSRAARGRLYASAAAGAALLVFALPGWDREALTKGPYYRPRDQMTFGVEVPRVPGLPAEEIVYYREGLNTTVSVHRRAGGLDARGNGKPEASLDDMPTQVLVGQVGALFGARSSPSGGRALLVGLASGITAGSLALHPWERLDVVEIEPAWVEASGLYADYNNRPLDRPNVRLLLDDGRARVETTRERYDVIVSEPSNPTISGVSNLFTREFFRAAHAALAPGGRLAQWVQLYDLHPDALRSILAAISAEFPYVYGFRYTSDFPDLILLAGDHPLTPADLPRFERLPAAVQDDLRRVMVFDTADLWSLLRLLPEDVRALAAAAPEINTDDAMTVELRGARVGADVAAAVKGLLSRGSGSVREVATANGGAPLSADMLARLALSFAVQRADGATASRLLEASLAAANATAPGPGVPVAGAPAAGGADAGGAVAGGAVAGVPAAGVPAAALVTQAVLEPARARELLDRAIARDPASFEARYLRARTAFQQDGPRGLPPALADVDAALAARPNDWRALHLRLMLRNAAGDRAGAQADADLLLATPLAPLFPDLWADAAVAAAGAGRLDEAERRLLAYLGRRPHAPAQWRTLAAWRDAAGRPGEARAALAAAAQAEQNQVLAAHRAARREMRFGSRERAQEMLRALVQRAPGYAPAREDLR